MLREKIQQTSSLLNIKPGESYTELKSIIEQIENSNKVLETEISLKKTANTEKQKTIDREKQSKINERIQMLDNMERDNILMNDLRQKIVAASIKLRDLNNEQDNGGKQTDSQMSKEHLMVLRQTNERLMNEIIRLNGVIKQQKATPTMSETMKNMSVSEIKFNEQSFDQSFMSRFK